jgi:WD40 repeat protein
LVRNYTFAYILGDHIYLGTTGGEICLFSISNRIYRATMPISNNGVLSFACNGDYIFVGSGDGKVKKICIAEDRWKLTHEAILDSKIMSLILSPDQKELMAGSLGGKIYRILENDLSFLVHTDAHTGVINDVHFSPRRSD